jgi:hypothetical protein
MAGDKRVGLCDEESDETACHLITRQFSAAGPNPEGIVSSSPRLRAASYPGKRWLATVNPNGRHF